MQVSLIPENECEHLDYVDMLEGNNLFALALLRHITVDGEAFRWRLKQLSKPGKIDVSNTRFLSNYNMVCMEMSHLRKYVVSQLMNF